MQIHRLVWTMVGNTQCLGNGQIHRRILRQAHYPHGPLYIPTRAVWGVQTNGTFMQIAPNAQVATRAHATTCPAPAPAGRPSECRNIAMANKKTTALKRCQDKTHRCVRSTTSHVQHEKPPLQAFALAVQPCADTSSRNTSWMGSAHKAVLPPAVLPPL